MKQISATDAARGFADLINRVRYQGETYEVVRNGETVARIAPTVSARALTAAEMDDLLRNLPPLDAAFGKDVAVARDASRSDRERIGEWER
ncbi:MAG TPA: type II toxin-antitoxin system prevent-host-death family antitoxin [Actinomycetota bacterium]|nr:type II toxin-antitoxin system prevent-host-death family antitoxin [Actinomycetota bacterium]